MNPPTTFKGLSPHHHSFGIHPYFPHSVDICIQIIKLLVFSIPLTSMWRWTHFFSSRFHWYPSAAATATADDHTFTLPLFIDIRQSMITCVHTSLFPFPLIFMCRWPCFYSSPFPWYACADDHMFPAQVCSLRLHLAEVCIGPLEGQARTCEIPAD